MLIAISKYQGAGNDFVLIDDRDENFPAGDHRLIRKLCDRRFGIGADGLMLLRNSADKDFTMLYFNSDGYEGTMCGNGGRCLVLFAHNIRHVEKVNGIKFSAIDGGHEASILKNGSVSLKMQSVSGVLKKGNGWGLNTGSIHHVEYVDNIVDMDVCRAGKTIRKHKMYSPDGCNVNFIKVDSSGDLLIRTYERGVEDETLACGTGAVASAIVHHHNGHVQNEYILKARGGTLSVSLDFANGTYNNIWLKGPARFVFNGEWSI